MTKTTISIPQRIVDQIVAHAERIERRATRPGREIFGMIVVRGTEAVRYRPMTNRARTPGTFQVYRSDLQAAHAELGADEWCFPVHSHPRNDGNVPSRHDLSGAAREWLSTDTEDRPYAILGRTRNVLRIFRLDWNRDRWNALDAIPSSAGASGGSNRELTKFRATLPPEGSALRICPPGCKVDHDANTKIREEREAPAARPSKPSTDREEGTMATTADIAGNFASKEASAYTRILNAKGKTVARAYQRKGGAVVLYFAEGALEGVSVAKELTVEAAKGGESKIVVNGGARQLQAARTVLKRAGAAAA